MWPNPQFPPHLVTFTAEILNGKIHLLCCDGCIILFISTPPKFNARNNKSSLDNSKFVSESILKALKKLHREIKAKIMLLNPLRLVFNLHYVNKFIKQNKFHLENLNTLMFTKDNYFPTFDLTSGYHHIEIHTVYCKILGFE